MVVHYGSNSSVCTTGVFVLENQGLIEKRYNAKPGDMIVTDIGSGFLTKETRAYWFYLFKNRISRIKKSHFWQMIDCGTIEIKYADKKYRRVQKRYRTLDTRNTTLKNLENEFEEFIDFVNFPCSVVFDPESDSKLEMIIRKLEELSLDYHEEKSYTSELKPVIRISG